MAIANQRQLARERPVDCQADRIGQERRVGKPTLCNRWKLLLIERTFFRGFGHFKQADELKILDSQRQIVRTVIPASGIPEMRLILYDRHLPSGV